MGTSVVFATPSLTHKVSLDYLRSALETSWLLMKNGISPGYIQRGGDQFIAKVRNKCVGGFLKDHPDAENLFFLDDDLGWPADKVLEYLQRPEDILCGVYPKKSEAEDWPVILWNENGALVERDGLVRCVNGPAGFMRIKRHVLERMAMQAGLFHDLEADGSVGTYPNVFTAGIGPDSWYWGEDYAFCMNADAAGFEIWCDPSIKFKHRGDKSWNGELVGTLDRFRERASQTANVVELHPSKESAA